MQASEIASAINIDRQHLLPVSNPEDTPFQYPELQKLTLAIQHALDRHHEPEQEESPKLPAPIKPRPLLHTVASSENPLLEYTLAAMKIPEPSKLLSFATKTLYASYGFERVLLAFIVPGKEKLEAKIGYGEQADAIQASFHCPLIKGNFWYRLLHQYQPVQFLSLAQENTVHEIPKEFLQLWGNHPGLAGSLYAPNKPIGLILADRGISKTALTDTDFAAFSVILSQTNANLARLAQSQ
jgi:hypothetical protein